MHNPQTITASMLQIDPDEVEGMTIEPVRQTKPKRARNGFETEWARFPVVWREVLHQAGSVGSTYDLALSILFEAFKREYVGGEIVLSAEMTRMTRSSRLQRAMRELVKLGLIKIHRQSDGQAYRVSLLN